MRHRKPPARKPAARVTDRLPADLFDPLAPTGRPPATPARGNRRRSDAAPAPTGRRVTRAEALGPRPYTAGGRPPAADLADVPPVRLTAYLLPDQVVRLRAEAGRRFAEGRRADLSMLLREAVEAVFPPPSGTSLRKSGRAR